MSSQSIQSSVQSLRSSYCETIQSSVQSLRNSYCVTLRRTRKFLALLGALFTMLYTTSAGIKISVTRLQLPITGAYTFTDYAAQGQILDCSMIDIGKVPSSELIAFNAYVLLSRGHGRDDIRFLGDFDDAMYTKYPSVHWRLEDRRLDRLNDETKKVWEERLRLQRTGL